MTPLAAVQPRAAPAAPAVDDPLDIERFKLAIVVERPPGRADWWMKRVGFPLGIALFAGILAMPLPAGLAAGGRAALASFALALIWWIAEPIPTYVTSLLLMVLLVFTGAWKEENVLGVLGLDVIWLNVLAFVLSAILVKTHLAKRIALHLLVRFGRRAGTTLLALLVVQLLLAPLIPATAARAVMTLPLMLVVAAIYRSTAQSPTNFGRNLFLQNLLGINIFSSGFMTGSTANLMAVGFILTMGGTRVYYTDWMFANLPVALIGMAIAWWVGPHLLMPIAPEQATPRLAGGIEALRQQLARMGRLSPGERRGLAIFGLVVFLWVTDRFHTGWFGFPISAVMAAMIGAIIALTPRIGLLTWNDTDIPWHLLIFSAGAYAGGLALDQTGAARWAIQGIFDALHLSRGMNFWAVYVVVIAVNMYAHFFFTSKTMRTVIMIPMVISVARYLGFSPLSLALPAAFTIDWVIGLPISAKPNLILFTTGQYSVLDQLKYSLVMTTVGVVLLVIAGLTWFRVLGITP
ncbi:MAG TPA: DASS family sodium-coupled anion symporter [Vicinamibacterales bacterium]|nr:DASS family sodium-coupled anion symporter [Vicinamibacterales bacterium]